MTSPVKYTRDQLYQARQYKTLKRAGVGLELGTATFNLFTITNGPVLVYRLIGHATELIAGTAVPRLAFTPTGGGAQTFLSAAAADIDTDAVNILYTWDGLLAGLLTPGVGIGHLDLTGAEAGFVSPITLVSGVIALTDTTAGAVTGGLIDWYISYLPLNDTGLIVAN